MKNFYLFILILLSFFTAIAQEKTISDIALDSVYLSSNIHEDYYAYSHKAIQTDSLQLEKLSDILKNNTAVFVREYGYGMLSSISLRGTGANHTQVVWNGIPVNSILNGQTDLNTVHVNNYEQVILKKGGSSVEYGSGAIGGILQLENRIRFEPLFQLENITNSGSFGRFENFSRLTYADKKYYASMALQTEQADNDYPYVGYDLVNENAAYSGYDYQLSAGYKINSKNRLYFKSQNDHLDRELARTLYMPEEAKLVTSHHRNLAGWLFQTNALKIQTDWAYLFESYDYYANKTNVENPDRSIANVFVAKNIISWKKNNKTLHWGNSYSYQEGESNNFEFKNRKIFASYINWSQKWKTFKYTFKLRKEFEKNYQIPLVGAIETAYTIKPNISIRANISKNYKLPTFNDLYWQPYGNPDLEPEESYAYESGLDYSKKNTQISITGFYIKSENLIKWTPDEDQWWSPKNIAHATYQGIEINAQQKFHLTTHSTWGINLNFTYQKTTDLDTGNNLPYVPLYMGQTGITYQYKKLKIKYLTRLNGKIYTTSTNTNYIPAVSIHNVALYYQINQKISLGGNINNIFNVYYETFPSRPEPGINYNLYINLKIK